MKQNKSDKSGRFENFGKFELSPQSFNGYTVFDVRVCPVTGSSSPGKGGGSSPDQEAAATAKFGETSTDYEPRMHRLQRQDAKSRKTFKIKRHRSTIKGHIIRSATVKGPLRVSSLPFVIL